MPQLILLNQDNKVVMSKYADKYFDLAIVDPPYFSGPEKRKYYGAAVSKKGVKRTLYPGLPAWSVPGSDYFNELFRVSKNQIIWGCNYYDYSFDPGRIIWDKCNGESSFSDCEIAYTSMHYSVRLFRYMWNGMMQGKSIREGHIAQGNKKLNENRIHPTQKPVALYKWLLKTYVDPEMKILDTHLGSGSSAIAALDFGIEEFVGCDIDPKVFGDTMARINNHKQQATFNYQLI